MHASINLALLAALCFAAQPSFPSEAFSEDFSEGLNPGKWTVSDWAAPHNSPENRGYFKPSNVKIVGGLLQLKLTQEQNSDGSITSVGGEVKTVRSFGFGIYRFQLKASSAQEDWATPGKAFSGSVTGAALFANKSETEIDIEMEGHPDRSHLTQTSTWTSEDEEDHEIVKVPPFSRYGGNNPHDKFHNYAFIWMPDRVEFYRDGELISIHRNKIPRKPGQFIFNHWGTNIAAWGGKATPGVVRYVYVRKFSFTPLEVK